jgi:putative ABC transport system permease protein
MNLLKQIAVMTSVNLRSLPQRIASALVVVVGIAGVVGVLVAVLALSTGLAKTLHATGRPDRAIVVHRQAVTEAGSALSRESVFRIADAAGIARRPDGKPIFSAEMLAVVNLPRQKDGALGTLTLRGVSPQMLTVRPEIRVIEGRMFRPGLQEVLVGQAARTQLVGLELGKTVELGGNRWTVVGVFESGGDVHESELLADANTVLAAYHRTTFNSVLVKLAAPESFEAFQAALKSDSTLAAVTARESDFYARHTQTFARFLQVIAKLAASIMAVGAIFAALNTMYSVVSARTTEIATLRAIGFGAGAVVVSVIIETLVLALIGAALGASIAWLLFNGNTVSTTGGGGIAQVVFHLRIGTELIVVGIVWACAVGLIGGLLPAVRAARLPVDTSLRAA